MVKGYLGNPRIFVFAFLISFLLGQNDSQNMEKDKAIGFHQCCLCHCLENTVKPFPKRQILDSSKLKEFADHNFKFDENGRKVFKWVENTVGKEEIAHYEQFLLFPQCFQRMILQTPKNQGLFGKGSNVKT